MESKIDEVNTQIFIFGWCENCLMGISYYNNLFFNGCMELHVDEIIIILMDIVKQHVRFIFSSSLDRNVAGTIF
jgi:hypothetical protein